MNTTSQSPPQSRKRKHVEHSDEMRACVVWLRDCFYSCHDITRLTRIPRSTAHSIVTIAYAEGRTAKKHKGGNMKPTQPDADALRQCITDTKTRRCCTATQRPCNCSRNTAALPLPSSRTLNRVVWRILQAEGFTTKSMQFTANARSTAETKEKRKMWVEQESAAAALLADTAIFMDETPFSMTIMRSAVVVAV